MQIEPPKVLLFWKQEKKASPKSKNHMKDLLKSLEKKKDLQKPKKKITASKKHKD